MSNVRLEKFRQSMKELNLDGALIYSDVNRNYLTGFTGDSSFIVVTFDKAIFITDSRYTEQASNEVLGFEVVEYTPPLYDFIKNIVQENNIKKLGIEEMHMTFADYEAYRERLDGVEFVKLNGAVEKLRTLKDAGEIENIEKAAGIADKAFEHLLTFIKPGLTENEIAIELEYFMKKLGASGTSFTSIVASGERSSLPHGVASDKVVKEGDLLTLDFGCVYNGYCSDMTRTIVIGKANDKQKEIYNTVLDAHLAAFEFLKPGAKCFDADKAARDIIEGRGYGERFGHGLGHGVGMEVHEMPRLSKRSDDVFEANMVVTNEPGIYIPGFGGVRIEDLVLITEDGYRILSKSPKHLIEL